MNKKPTYEELEQKVQELKREAKSRKMAEEELRESEKRFREFFEASIDGIAESTLEGKLISCNFAYSSMTGYSEKELKKLKYQDLTPIKWAEVDKKHIQQCLERGYSDQYEKERLCKDGRIIPISMRSFLRKDAIGNPIGFWGIIQDITDRKREEQQKSLKVRILDIINKSDAWKDSIEEIISEIKQFAGMDAVAIRLMEGEDFPYYVTKGFPSRFVEAERYLCTRDHQGEIVRDSKGNPYVECMCGNVICGRTDASKDFFTGCGSFVSNHTSALLAETTDEDRQTRTRNRCNSEGYESVALFPLRVGSEIFGLLQLNDTQPHQFTDDSIHFFEDIAIDIGTAFSHKQVKDSLRETEANMAVALRLAKMGSWTWDIKSGDITWSNNSCRIHGLKPGEFDRQFDTAMSFTHPDDLDSVKHNIQKILDEKKPFEFEYRIITQDGVEKNLIVYQQLTFDAEGNVERLVGTFQDITARKQADQELERLLHERGERIKELKCMYGVADSIQSRNTLKEILQDVANLIPPGWHYPAITRAKVIFEGKEYVSEPFEETEWKQSCELVVDNKRVGSIEVYYLEECPDFDEGPFMTEERNLIEGIAKNLSDAIELKNAEKQLVQSQKMEAIGTLAGGIAHDFNNILAAIIGYAEMAKDDCQPESSVAEDLDKVLEGGNRAKDLVQQILAFSRQDEMERFPMQPASVVNEAIKMLRPSLPTTIEINQDITTATGLILADPTRLHQILMNLCTNAFHAMEETGGKLDISLKEVTLSTEDLVHELNVEAGTFVQLSVRDSGPGIATEIRNNIFNPYFTTKKTGKGTGMGLAIVHGIVKSYGGFISLYSEQGVGTAFHIFIPVIEKEPLPDIDDIEPIPAGRDRILFIDDEEILTKIGKSMLEKLGYHVTARNNSMEALETFQNQPDLFDLVITDQTMPGMTGADIATKMIEIRPDIPIILCTGYSTVISEEKAKSMGINEFALKPLSKKDMSVLIRKVLDNS